MILTAFDVSVVDVEDELSFFAHEIIVRLKKDISMNYKIFFIFFLKTSSTKFLVNFIMNSCAIRLDCVTV